MPVQSLFPTEIYVAPLGGASAAALNRQLLAECLQLRADDRGGQQWSRQNYPGGYTSYDTAHRMHQRSPTFAALRRAVDRHVRRYVKTLAFDLEGRSLGMTDCWVNIMPQWVSHSLHLHPLSTLSGTYYVRTPRGCAGLKFEDPRLDRYMAAPPRQAWTTVPAEAGNVVLFESWLRHEVPPNPSRGERISISFNYHWA